MPPTVTISIPVNDPEILDQAQAFLNSLSYVATKRREANQENDQYGPGLPGDEGEPTASEKTTQSTKPEKVTVAPVTPGPVTPEAKPTVSPGPEKTSETPPISPDVEVDDIGMPHDSRVHRPTKAKSKKAPFIWLLVRGLDKDLVAKYHQDWLNLGYGQPLLDARVAAKLAKEALSTPAAPAAPAAPPLAPLPPEQRMTPEANHVPYASFKSVTPPWTDAQMIEAGKLYPEDWHPETSIETQTTPVTDFTTLIVEVCSPNLEAGNITQEAIDTIVSEVTGGVATTVSLIPQAKAEAHIPAIVERIHQTIAAAS